MVIYFSQQSVRNHPLPIRMPDMGPLLSGKKCLALDLDETLVHSSFQVLVSYRLIRQLLL